MTTHELAKKLLEMPDVPAAIYNDVSGDNELLQPADVQMHENGVLCTPEGENVVAVTREPFVLFAVA